MGEVLHFKCVGCNILCKVDYGVNSRIVVHTFQGVFGMINRKYYITKLKFFKAMTLATLFLWQCGISQVINPLKGGAVQIFGNNPNESKFHS